MSENKVAQSFAFKFIERVAAKGLGLVISIVLARLVAKELHGLVAIVMVFVNLAQTFVQSGMSTALVQNRDTGSADYSTVLYLSLGVAAVMNVALYFGAPLIARLYESDALILPLRVLALSLFFGAFNSIQTAKMQREMRFREMMRCNLLAVVISGALGVAAAFMGAGLWALVIYQMAQVIAVSICMAAADRWRPQLVFSLQRARVLFSFGWKMLVSALLTSLYSEIRTLLVGYKYSTAELADYNKGFQFPNVISNTLDVSIQSVMLPVMARAQDEPERLNRMLFRTLTLSMFMVVPVMLGLAAVAETLIPMLLGPEWGSCVPLMCVFCLSDLMLPVKSTNLSLLKATGRSDIYMKTEMVRRVIMLAVLLVTVLLFDSVLVIAIGYALNSWLDAYIITRAVRVQTGVSWWQQIRTLWKTLLSGAVMLALVWAMNYLPVLPILRLLMQLASGAAAYVLLSALLKNEAFFFVLGKIRSLLGRKGQRQNAG